jgi:hypothetical protein
MPPQKTYGLGRPIYHLFARLSRAISTGPTWSSGGEIYVARSARKGTETVIRPH